MGDPSRPERAAGMGNEGEPQIFNWASFFRNRCVMILLLLYALLFYKTVPSPHEGFFTGGGLATAVFLLAILLPYRSWEAVVVLVLGLIMALWVGSLIGFVVTLEWDQIPK